MKKIILIFAFWSAISAHAQSQKLISTDSNLKKLAIVSIKSMLQLSNYEATNVYAVVSYYQQKQYDIIRDTSLKTKIKSERLNQLATYRQNKLKFILNNEQMAKLQDMISQNKFSLSSENKKLYIVASLTKKGISTDKAEKASVIYLLYSTYVSQIYKDQTIKLPEKKQRLHDITVERDQKLRGFLTSEQLEMISRNI